MERVQELAIIRRAYAKQILAAVQIEDPSLELAFAQVRREDFLGPGPWVLPRWFGGYLPTPSADPVYLYIDNVVQIIAERHLNNGQPSAHAKWIASASIKPGEHVVHVGTGAGYYTAIMSHLPGPPGEVTGIELDAGLAARAKENLSSFSNVRIVNGNGAAIPFGAADVIYVNAGVTRPADLWLDTLTDGGRLMLPLTTNEGFLANDPANLQRRAVFRIERRTPNFWRSGSVLSKSFHVRERATRHPKLLSLKRSRRVVGSGSLASIGMRTYLKNVVGFVSQDGAWPTIDGRLRLGSEDRRNGRFLARSCPCARGDFCRPVAEAVWGISDPRTSGRRLGARSSDVTQHSTTSASWTGGRTW
jgi:protein-L-isoaspartate(D-aspartate) O-methyltransferase